MSARPPAVESGLQDHHRRELDRFAGRTSGWEWLDAEGIAALEQAHPDVRCWTAAIDSHLNEIGYIIPGLGDAGDKIFGTKEDA